MTKIKIKTGINTNLNLNLKNDEKNKITKFMWTFFLTKTRVASD